MIRSLREKLQTFWDRPTAALLLFMGVIMTMWTLQCSLLQNILGLDILETVTWGAQMTWGHSKHPPLSGWLGYFFSAISGHADWSLYLAAQASLMIGVRGSSFPPTPPRSPRFSCSSSSITTPPKQSSALTSWKSPCAPSWRITSFWLSVTGNSGNGFCSDSSAVSAC